MKHTSGPWFAHSNGSRAWVKSETHFVAELSDDTDRCDADARLIAAAPTLLKGLKLAVMEFERIAYQKKIDPELMKLFKKAIAKAEGTEP